MNQRSKKVEKNKDFEPVIVLLIALLKEMSKSQKIDAKLRERIVLALSNSGYSQLDIASMIGISATDVNKIVKTRK